MKYIAVDFSQNPLKVRISDDYINWTSITDPEQIHEILKEKPDYIEYRKKNV